ncbi:hypothetical protein AOLI_G00158280 [Acnodon oligacanthus]
MIGRSKASIPKPNNSHLSVLPTSLALRQHHNRAIGQRLPREGIFTYQTGRVAECAEEGDPQSGGKQEAVADPFHILQQLVSLVECCTGPRNFDCIIREYRKPHAGHSNPLLLPGSLQNLNTVRVIVQPGYDGTWDVTSFWSQRVMSENISPSGTLTILMFWRRDLDSRSSHLASMRSPPSLKAPL